MPFQVCVITLKFHHQATLPRTGVYPVFRITLLICWSLAFLWPMPLLSQESVLHSFRDLVRTETWKEETLDAQGISQPQEVTAEIWTAAFQAALAQRHTLHIPSRPLPYYIDAPLILKSGDSLTADKDAEIRLKPGTNTCMVRNENIRGFGDRPVPADTQPDTGITIEGGIWTTLVLGPQVTNGNVRGASSQVNPVPGTHGVILLQNVRRVLVKNLTVRQSKAFAVHLGNVSEFRVEGIRLDRHWRDGVHVNGPASHGVIRDVRGESHDDTISIAAWDWRNYAASFGPIHHLQIEKISGVPEKPNSADAIRLLPGVKRFEDGTTLDCTISDVVLQDISDIREFKLYDQPNLEHGRDKDYSAALGTLRNIKLQNLTFTRPGVIQIAAEVDGLSVEGVDFQFTPPARYRLIEIGPMSQTYSFGPDPSQKVEIFSPDRDVTVRGFQLGKVSIEGELLNDADAEARFLQVKDQQPNPDYPRTTPRGGTGKAKLVR